jgi:hypothetical protein
MKYLFMLLLTLITSCNVKSNAGGSSSFTWAEAARKDCRIMCLEKGFVDSTAISDGNWIPLMTKLECYCKTLEKSEHLKTFTTNDYEG